MIELYRHFSASGELLYVGIAKSTLVRLRAHQRYSHWAHEITSIEIERYPDRASALVAEAQVIRSEHPLHNVKHTPAASVPRGKGSPAISAETATRLIEAAGGDAQFARLLGITGLRAVQRVNNWKRRGIPWSIALKHHDLLQRTAT